VVLRVAPDPYGYETGGCQYGVVNLSQPVGFDQRVDIEVDAESVGLLTGLLDTSRALYEALGAERLARFNRDASVFDVRVWDVLDEVDGTAMVPESTVERIDAENTTWWYRYYSAFRPDDPATPEVVMDGCVQGFDGPLAPPHYIEEWLFASADDATLGERGAEATLELAVDTEHTLVFYPLDTLEALPDGGKLSIHMPREEQLVAPFSGTVFDLSMAAVINSPRTLIPAERTRPAPDTGEDVALEDQQFLQALDDPFETPELMASFLDVLDRGYYTSRERARWLIVGLAAHTDVPTVERGLPMPAFSRFTPAEDVFIHQQVAETLGLAVEYLPQAERLVVAVDDARLDPIREVATVFPEQTAMTDAIYRQVAPVFNIPDAAVDAYCESPYGYPADETAYEPFVPGVEVALAECIDASVFSPSEVRLLDLPQYVSAPTEAGLTQQVRDGWVLAETLEQFDEHYDTTVGTEVLDDIRLQ
jgi:hypothetical protein